MAIRAPDQALLASREELSDFFLVFARYEFALKATDFAKETEFGAQIDWNKLASKLGDLDSLLGSRRADIAELLDHPPKKLHLTNTGLKWLDDIPKDTWDSCRVFLYRTQAVRNNLMHGSKQIDQESYDPDRERKLLASAMAAIEIILSKLPDTKRAFEGPAP